MSIYPKDLDWPMPKDRPHWLVVDAYDGLSDTFHAQDRELIRVEHDPACPVQVQKWRNEQDEIEEVESTFTCRVGDQLLELSISDYFVHHREPDVETGEITGEVQVVTPGRHRIEAWSERHWTEYGYEYDGGLRLVEEPSK